MDGSFLAFPFLGTFKGRLEDHSLLVTPTVGHLPGVAWGSPLCQLWGLLDQVNQRLGVRVRAKPMAAFAQLSS